MGGFGNNHRVQRASSIRSEVSFFFLLRLIGMYGQRRDYFVDDRNRKKIRLNNLAKMLIDYKCPGGVNPWVRVWVKPKMVDNLRGFHRALVRRTWVE